MRILILGLDGAGKTTILYRLQVGEVITTIPTIGFNVETVTYKNLKFQVWDLGGQTSIRPYWRCYYSKTDAVIYVVDSCDRDRIGISKSELVAMLEVSRQLSMEGLEGSLTFAYFFLCILSCAIIIKNTQRYFLPFFSFFFKRYISWGLV